MMEFEEFLEKCLSLIRGDFSRLYLEVGSSQRAKWHHGQIGQDHYRSKSYSEASVYSTVIEPVWEQLC